MGMLQMAGLVAAALVVVWAVIAYNALVRRRNEIANAFAQIDVQFKRRHDLIPNLVETARKYLQHEQGTLESVAAARAGASRAADAMNFRYSLASSRRRLLPACSRPSNR